MKTNDQYNIIVMNYDKKLKLYSEIENAKLIKTDFRSIIIDEFKKNVILSSGHLTIVTDTYKAYCGTEDSKADNIEIDIYGAEGMTALNELSKKMDWQIFNKQTNRFH